MSESNAMPIPEDLEFEYDSLKECAKHGRLTYQFNVEGMCGLIERIGRAEQRVQELEAALRGHDALLDAVNSATCPLCGGTGMSNHFLPCICTLPEPTSSSAPQIPADEELKLSVHGELLAAATQFFITGGRPYRYNKQDQRDLMSCLQAVRQRMECAEAALAAEEMHQCGHCGHPKKSASGSLLDKSVAKATARVRALLSKEAQPKEEA